MKFWGLKGFFIGVIFASASFIGTSLLSEHWSSEAKPTTQTSGKSVKSSEKASWLLPLERLRIHRLCRGSLGAEFGYAEPTQKAIVFLKSKAANLELVSATARLENSSIQISSIGLSDLNFELIEDLGYLSQHGRIKELRELDAANDSRWADTLVEQAAYLCFQDVQDSIQQDLLMEEFYEEIFDELAYVAIEWPEAFELDSIWLSYQQEGWIRHENIPVRATDIL